VEASPPAPGYRLKKFLRRHRGAVLSACVILLLLAGGIVGTAVGLVRAQKRLAQVEKGVDLLGSIFEDLDPKAEENEGRPLRAILGERLDRAAADLEGEAVGDPLVVAGLQDRLGRTYLALGHPSKAKALFTKALATRRARLGADHPDVLGVMAQRAEASKELGEMDEAIALLGQARDAQARLLGAEHRATLATQNRLAVALWAAGRTGEAIALLEQTRGSLIGQLGPDHPQTIDVTENLSGVYLRVDRQREAIDLAKQVLDACVKRYGIDHSRSLAALNNLAFKYQASGQMRKALALFEEVRDAIVPKLGPDHPKTLILLDNLARLYRAFGRTAEAIALAEQVRDARVLLLGVHHPRTVRTLDTLALAYQDAGNAEKALALFQQAAAGVERMGFVHDEDGNIIGDLCDCLEKRGQSDQADAWRGKWLAAVRKKDGPRSASYAEELAEQAERMLRRGRHADAEPLLLECLAIRQESQSEDWTTCHTRSLLGDALLGQKKYAEAEPILVQGYEGLKAREGQIPPLYARYRITEAGERVVQLYEAWGQTDKAAAWRTKLPRPHEGGEASRHHTPKH
jgi:tetratricopeptide (TPR) repeat protein